MKSSFIILVVISSIVRGALGILLTNIWQSLEITNPSKFSRPQDIRTAKVGWKIITDDVLPNDNFYLLMPYVFRTKFDRNEISLKVDGKVLSTCKVHEGTFNSHTSYLKCTMDSSVNDNKGLIAAGEILFDFVFNAGGSSYDADILSANRFSSGTNEVSFNNFTSNVSFQPGPFFTDKNIDDLLYYSRSTPQGSEQVFVLGGVCKEGIVSGSIVFTSNNSIDCSIFNLKMTKDLNDFYLPKSYESVNIGSIRCSNDNSKLTATFNNIPQDFRVFLEGFEKYPENSSYVKHLYAENIKCGDGSSKVDGITKIINVVDGISSSDGNTEVSSSEVYSSVQDTSSFMLSSTSHCKDCEYSTTSSDIETGTSHEVNTSETVCKNCSNSLETFSNAVPSSTDTSIGLSSSNSLPTDTTSRASTSALQTCRECTHSISRVGSDNACSSDKRQSTCETSVSSETSVSRETTSCQYCKSSLSTNWVQPTGSHLTYTPTSSTFTQSEPVGTQNKNSSKDDYSSPLDTLTSIPPAIGTTESISLQEITTDAISSKRKPLVTLSPSSNTRELSASSNSSISTDDTFCDECSTNWSFQTLSEPTFTFSCNNCTSTALEYASSRVESNTTPPSSGEIYITLSNIADTSVTALGKASSFGESAIFSSFDSQSTLYTPALPSSATNVQSVLYSYRAMANTNQYSMGAFLLSIVALIV